MQVIRCFFLNLADEDAWIDITLKTDLEPIPSKPPIGLFTKEGVLLLIFFDDGSTVPMPFVVTIGKDRLKEESPDTLWQWFLRASAKFSEAEIQKHFDMLGHEMAIRKLSREQLN